jgi:isoleucyl-tRNA synthetase
MRTRNRPAIDVGFPVARCVGARACGARLRRRGLPEGDCFTVIWTTTPWTMPANQAAQHASGIHLRTGADRAVACLILAAELRAAALERYGLQGQVLGACQGAALEVPGEVPPSLLRPCQVAGVSGRVRDAGCRYRHRPQRAGLRPGGLRLLSQARHAQRRDPTPRCRATACSPRRCRFFGGMFVWKANPSSSKRSPRPAACCQQRDRP